jgi:RimJ/RimL family protein N-acetyltransferase
MSEAVKAATGYGITYHQLTRVFARTFDWNPASARVLEKAGFVLEGRLRRSAMKDGKVVDQLQYACVVPG